MYNHVYNSMWYSEMPEYRYMCITMRLMYNHA